VLIVFEERPELQSTPLITLLIMITLPLCSKLKNAHAGYTQKTQTSLQGSARSQFIQGVAAINIPNGAGKSTLAKRGKFGLLDS
jgi:hypothetical protein